MDFNIKTTALYKALKLKDAVIFNVARPLKILLFVLGVICLALVLFIAWQGEAMDIWDKILGAAFLAIFLAIFFAEIDSFFENKIKNPKMLYSLAQFIEKPDDFNAAGFFDINCLAVFKKAFVLSKKTALGEPTSLMLLYCLVNSNQSEVDFVFGRGGLDQAYLQKVLANRIKEIKNLAVKPAPDFQKIILPSAKAALESGKQKIYLGDLLVGFALADEFFQKFLTQSDFKKDDIFNLVSWYSRLEKTVAFRKRFWDKENLMKNGSIARDFAAGYTITVDKYARDIRRAIRKGGEQEIVGHKREAEQVERVLEREELNNVLLVGEPGVGRKSVVRLVAQKAFFGKSLPSINYKRFLEFDLTALVAGLANQSEVERALETCFSEIAKAGNIILVVNDFENFVQEQAKPGAVNITAVLTRYLAFSSFQMIATVSYAGLHNIVERNSSLLNLFDKVEVEEISPQETMVYLQNLLPFFEAKHKKIISYLALRETIKLSERYLADSPFPDKANRLLDETMVFLSGHSKDKVLLPKHIQRIVADKTQIPVGEAEEKEKEKLLNMEALLHQRLINQEEAVSEVSSALRRARAEVNIKAGPIGSFLFLGPTGVGKTETAKALAAIYFGSEQRMIRLDMSEFQNTEDVKRLLGSDREVGLLTTAVKENPFSLLLLDELEKAHPNVLNLFLQTLDEGWLTDGVGRKVDFKNTIIIATSNAGAELIRQRAQEGAAEEVVKQELKEFVLREGIFKPEFINRFDAVVVFKPLSKEHLLQIAHLQLSKLAKSLTDKGIKLDITKELKEKIVELSYSPEFGAREMKRVLQDKVENVLAKAILSCEIKRGARISIDPGEFRIIIG